MTSEEQFGDVDIRGCRQSSSTWCQISGKQQIGFRTVFSFPGAFQGVSCFFPKELNLDKDALLLFCYFAYVLLSQSGKTVRCNMDDRKYIPRRRNMREHIRKNTSNQTPNYATRAHKSYKYACRAQTQVIKHMAEVIFTVCQDVL